MNYRVLLASLVVLLPASLVAQQRPPSPSDWPKLFKTYHALDARTQDGWQKQSEILAELARVPPLSASQVTSARKDIARAADKQGRRLEGQGELWFWEDKKAKTKRGRFFLDGETKKPKGLIVSMHGGGEGAGDCATSHGMYADAVRKLGWLGLFPEVLDKTERGWTDAGTEEFVLDLVAAAMRTFKIDPDRVYLGGFSMGGYGSWALGAHHADRWAAIAPAAGAPTPVYDRPGGKIIDIQEGVLPNLRNVFVASYQGLLDTQVTPDASQEALRRLAQLSNKHGGYAFDRWEDPEQQHNYPQDGALAHLQKLVDKKRTPLPERVVWQPELAWKRQFYWLWWESPVRGAMLVADLDKASNTVSLTCDQPTDGLFVLLDERVLDVAKPVTVSVNGKSVFTGVPKLELANLLRTSGTDAALMFSVRVPAFAAK